MTIEEYRKTFDIPKEQESDEEIEKKIAFIKQLARLCIEGFYKNRNLESESKESLEDVKQDDASLTNY